MYTIKAFTADGGEYWIHNPKAKDLITGSPYYKTGDNINGEAHFTIYPDHPYYSKVVKLTTDITIYKDGEEVFSGRVLYDDEDMAGRKKVFVEGELGYLCDSIQRPAVYHDISPEDYLTEIIDIHNSQVEERKQFVVGRVTVEDSNDSIYRYSNWETTRETLEDKLLDRLGGHLVIRKEDGVRYLDYLSDDDYYENATQTIEFGKNLLDFAKNADATDLVTCLIPLGATQDEEVIEGLDAYLTIEDVNGGVDYVTDDAAVAQYGRIFGTQHWDDVTVASNLKAKGEEYLKTVQYEALVLELTAIDLNLTDDEIEALHVGHKVRCISTPNGIDAWYPISEMTVYLTQFSKNTFTLGIESQNATYTSSNRQSTAELTKTINSTPTKSEILAAALESATALINAKVASGYAIHEPNEFIVADDPDYKEQAKNLWRWGLGGLAHYSNGYSGEADGIAITMDGQINGEMLMAGSVIAEKIDAGYTEALESEISDAEDSANEYTDSKTKAVQETIEVSLSNLEQQISLAVTDTKEAIVQKNYVANGESETLTLDDWTISGSAATAEIAEYQNVNCLKLTFTAAGVVTIQQSLGTLSAGTYTVQAQSAYDSDYTAPLYFRCGFSTSYATTYFSTSVGEDNFYTFKREMEITAASKTAYFAVYGKSGSVVYIKNMRCLRNFEELLDELSSNLTVAIGEVSASVSEVYENSLHDYCLNGSFDDEDDAFTSWYRNSSSYVTSSTYDDLTCAAIANPSSGRYYIRQSFKNPSAGRVKIRCKAACASGYESTARIRCYVGGYSQYTTAGDLSTDWQTFEFEFESIAAGTIYVYLYNYVYSTTVYITDVEILGYFAAYGNSQLTVLSDSITAEVTRATAAEETLAASIQVNADSITSCVTKSNFGTYITQNYSYVRVAWNNYTKYIQFENASLNVYDSSSTLLMSLKYTGQWFYYQGVTVGKIGTNYFSGHSDYRGLTFDLNYTGDYMTWAAQSSSSSSYYTKLAWYRDTTIAYTGFNLYDYFYAYSYLKFTEDSGVYAWTSYDSIKLYADGYIYLGSSSANCCAITGTSITVYNSISVDFYSTLNLHGWGYTNDSDVRLKTNIEPTKINGLEVLNGIDLKEFDWIESGEHQEIGLIAQQIQAFAPELIVEDSATGCLRLKTDQLVYYCIKAIQELCSELDIIKRPKIAGKVPELTDSEKNAFVDSISQNHRKDVTPGNPNFPAQPILPKRKGE